MNSAMTALTLAEAPLVNQLRRMADQEQMTTEALLLQAVVEFLERENTIEWMSMAWSWKNWGQYPAILGVLTYRRPVQSGCR